MADETKKTDGEVTTPLPPVGGVVGDKDEKKKKKDVIEVDRATIEAILERQKQQDKEISRLTKDNEKLIAVADKGRLSLFDQQHNDQPLIRNANLNVWQGKIVLGWKTVKDEVGVMDGRIYENQVVEMYLDDGVGNEPKAVQVNYLDFGRNMRKMAAEIVKQSKTKYGEAYTLQTKDGREYEIDIRFIN